MPRTNGPFLTDGQISIIRRWIEARRTQQLKGTRRDNESLGFRGRLLPRCVRLPRSDRKPLRRSRRRTPRRRRRRTIPDRDVNLAQPDFNLAALPTTLRLPKYGSAFRITHRFGRPLGAGDFGDLVEDLFGFDNGASSASNIASASSAGAQLGIHRTSNKTIQFFSQYDIMNQRDGASSASRPTEPSRARTTSRTATHPGSARCSRAKSASTRRSTSSRSG